MCGILGVFGKGSVLSASQIKNLLDSLNHRGPDDSGIWQDKTQQVLLGHTRLSILDTSYAGHQPMASSDDRFVIVFNGEIYNHQELRNKLEFREWRGHSDTETLLACFKSWGVEKTLQATIGMFALALWDNNEKKLILARDRVGEKPLYYGFVEGTLIFGSELKALRAFPYFKAEIDRDVLALYMRHNMIPAPHCIYKGFAKLQPGTWLELSGSCIEQKEIPQPKIYWSACDVAKDGVRTNFLGTPNDAVDELERLIKNSIDQQMVADVPIGAFLSGGIDSSTIVSLMQNQSVSRIKTFTIGLHEKNYNEAMHAKAVAKYLGTDHTELYVTPGEAMSVIPDLPTLYSEPFADSSQIPTFLVSKLAKQQVTVSLSGDAGDELFCGYNRYQITKKHWSKLSMLPVSLRTVLAKGIHSFSPQAWNNLAAYMPGAKRFNNIGDKLHKGAGVLDSRSVEELYLGLVSAHPDPTTLVIDAKEPSTLVSGNTPDLTGLSEIERMMALDLITYLPDDILVKVDRAAMGVSLETRVPFLDHRIVEFAWSLPQSIKLREGQTKWPLRQVLYRHVPRELIERPKMGFGIPLDKWLRAPLRDWAESLLDESRLRKEGFFHPEPIRALWSEHLSGKQNRAYLLWSVLMFQAWLEEQ